MKTFIFGKDAALEDSILYFYKKLHDFNFDIEEISWLNPVPHIWSVHIRDRNCSLCFSNGKGVTKKAALASALGEYFERLSTNYFFADFYLGEKISKDNFVHYPNEKWFSILKKHVQLFDFLDHHLYNFYNLKKNSLINLVDLQSSNITRGVCTLPFLRQSDQKIVYFPINILDNIYASNGMAVGNTSYEARVQALSEILERYVKNYVIKKTISLPIIPSHVLDRYKNIKTTISKLKEAFPILLYDASLGGNYPVICIVLFNSKNGTCFVSFGAHPNFGVALERALTELLQGRSLKDLDNFFSPTFDNKDVADKSNLEAHFIDSNGLISWDMFKKNSDYPYVDWNFIGNTKKEFYVLMSLFHQKKIEVYIAEYQHLGIYACRIIVPGISEIYSIKDLEIVNNNMGIHLRDIILNLPSSQWNSKKYLSLIQWLDNESLNDSTRICELLGIASEKNNAWYTLRIGELKAMLALAAYDFKQALIWVEWTRDFNFFTFSKSRNNYYRCLHDLLFVHQNKYNPTQYYNAFIKMYNQETFNVSLETICGKNRFYGLCPIDNNLEKLSKHQELLVVYNKLKHAKCYYWKVKMEHSKDFS
ncbi:Ribosomal protein S12 methylthiotransferase accessory factor YcaO [Candidatus Ecksteinia adelgidicola]|nr:Ribosomal protein S12 methylthiotransferase accessory factor YcaO [Candidatus Ecksteinia adelgidicola]